MLWNHIRFICRHYFKNARAIFVYLFINMAALLLIPLISVYLPRIVVQGVTEGWQVSRLIFWVGGLTAAISLLNVCNTVCTRRYREKTTIGRLELGMQWQEMLMTCQYTLTEDPRWQMKIGEGGNAIFSDGRTRGIAGMMCGLQDFFINALGIFSFGVILGVLHPLVLLLLIITSLIPGIVANRVSMYEFNQRENWQPYDRQIQYIYWHITTSQAGKEVRIYKGREFFLRQMEEAILKRLVWLKRIMLRRLKAEGVSALMLVLQNSVSLGWIVYEITRGQISVADFAFYAGAVIQFTQFVNQFVQGYSVVRKCSYDVQRVREGLAYAPQKKAELAEMPADSPAPEIQFCHVSFRYPGSDRTILEDINFRIRPGEKIALVGGNGAGKTTLVKLLCGFYQPTSGQVLVNGRPLSEMEEGEQLSLFSAVFQDMLILPFSVMENVAVAGKADVARVRRCLEQAGLSERFPNLNAPLVKEVQEEAENLSGGEQQKLLLARALYKEAPALILDEPTAALDPLAESRLYEQYNELCRKKTSLFISHRLASTSFCDRIFLMGNGRILEEGTHEELLALGGIYAHMFYEQGKYYQDQEAAE